MSLILVTGMSGAGKSSVLAELARRGHQTVDTDTDEWCEWVTVTGDDGQPEPDWIWRKDRMAALLADHRAGHLFVAGCKSNQGQFYDRFGAVVLLTAPEALLLRRVATRTNNPYGQRDEERELIRGHIATVEPRLRQRATAIIDTDRPVAEVADLLERVADAET